MTKKADLNKTKLKILINFKFNNIFSSEIPTLLSLVTISLVKLEL